MNEKKNKQSKLRTITQLISTVFFNGYFMGFVEGKIYTGNMKVACVPVFNCYSCPGAKGACPIGAMQAVLGSSKYNFTFYVFGMLMLFGLILGRVVCGFLCPFGWIQDLLHKIPTPKVKVIPKIDIPARYIKYIILILTIMLPVVLTNKFGQAQPYFCKFFCPVGTLEGGIPLVLSNKSLQASIGFLFGWKFMVLVATLTLCIFVNRGFCRYFCPLGAFYGMFNRFSICSLSFNEDKCVNCNQCTKTCPMSIDVTKEINSAECIKCGRCKSICPTQAIDYNLGPIKIGNKKNFKEKTV